MSKKKLPIVLNEDELAAKGTRELLGYLKRLQQCQESYSLSDYDVNSVFDEKIIYFKDTEKWKNAFTIVKVILKNREHIK